MQNQPKQPPAPTREEDIDVNEATHAPNGIPPGVAENDAKALPGDRKDGETAPLGN